MPNQNGTAYRVSCDCGCGDGIEFHAAFGRLYVHSFRGDWYSAQETVLTALKDRLRYMRGNRNLRDLVLTVEDLRGIKAFLESVEFDPCWRPEDYGYATLSFSRDDDFGEPLYQAFWDGRMLGRGVLLGWYHRLFALDVGPDDRDRMVREIDAALGD